MVGGGVTAGGGGRRERGAKRRGGAAAAAAAGALLAAAVGGARGALISSSRLESCFASAGAPAPPGAAAAAGAAGPRALEVACEQKVVVTLAVPTGRVLATERVEARLGCVGASECPCACDYARDIGCTCRDLDAPLSLAITKSPVRATYPIYYWADVNAKPREVVVQAPEGGCRDGDLEETPTCGWYLDPDTHRKIPNSQGFCCACSSGDVFEHTTQGPSESSRGDLDCDLFDFWFSPPTSAHCLVMDPTWYKVYGVGESQLAFDLEVELGGSEGSAAGTPPGKGAAAGHDGPDGAAAGGGDSGARPAVREQTLVLSPQRPRALSEGQWVGAELLGDLQGFQALPVLSEKYLLVPHPKGLGPNEVLSQNSDRWLLLDKSFVSLEGHECDKIGVGFTPFRYQEERCGRRVGSCLGNQVDDFLREDEERVAAGQTPKYLITRWGGGHAKQVAYDLSSSELKLQLPVEQLQHSVVTLTINAAEVRLVTNLAPGVIAAAAVCDFRSESCGGFQAGRDRGYLDVSVRNTGYIASDFLVAVANCSARVEASPAQLRSIAAQEEAEFRLQLHVSDDAQDDDRFCWIALQNARAEILDERRIGFFTNATQYASPVLVPGEVDAGGGGGGGTRPSSLQCRDFCPKIWDAPCHVVHRCWSRLGLLLALVLLLLLVATMVRRQCCGGGRAAQGAPQAQAAAPPPPGQRGTAAKAQRRAPLRCATAAAPPPTWVMCPPPVAVSGEMRRAPDPAGPRAGGQAAWFSPVGAGAGAGGGRGAEWKGPAHMMAQPPGRWKGGQA